MDKTQVAIFAALIAVVAIRLYQKYNKKKKGGSTDNSGQTRGGSFPTASTDDDYEPYSRK